MEILLLVIGIIIGIVIGFLFVSQKKRSEVDAAMRNHPLVDELRKNIEFADTQFQKERNEKEKKIAELATAQQQLASMTERLELQMGEVEKLRKNFQQEFENLANRIFDDKSEKFKAQNKEQLDALLNPFKDKLRDFEKKVDDVYKEENKERITLKAELRHLAELNKQLSSEANSLTIALKGDNKTQGNWGEVMLEKILERSGLIEGEGYRTQVSTTNAEGERMRPDVVIYLPEGKHIIVDSKVSLAAYTACIAAENEEDKLRYLKAHAESIRSHVKQLGDKNYHSSAALESPDFVLLFMPIEPALAAALQYDSDLFSYAWDRRIVIVSPSTLFATLRTVASIWTQEKQTRNTMMIAEEGGKLYDKFVAFVEDLIAVGKQMDAAKKCYADAMNKLQDGTGNLVKRAQRMKDLGAKATKQIHPQLVERAGGETQTESRQQMF